jgi:hypothetical protein
MSMEETGALRLIQHAVSRMIYERCLVSLRLIDARMINQRWILAQLSKLSLRQERHWPLLEGSLIGFVGDAEQR